MTNRIATDPRYAEFLEWLRENVNDDLRERLEYSYECFVSFLEDIDIDGHIEIAGQYTNTGNPVTNTFPALRR